MAADCLPRTSPPSASAASSARRRRSLNGSSADSRYARAIAGQHVSRSSRLPCTVNASPSMWPAAGIVSDPVKAATPPRASTTPSCRCCAPGSLAISAATTSLAERPARSSSRPIGPNEMLTDAWVAMAPTPASAHGTTGPTLRKCDCTATPKRPVAGSRATML